ncbi:MAG TPA: hypothetical protein VEF76_01545 [Patescibacteria group bacterium]|nr:hypothetical protein [Patescibacteria group bacterium]
MEKKPEKRRGPLFIPACIGVAGFAAFLVSAPYWATDEAGAMRVLAAQGYRNIRVGGYDSFGCGFDVYATKFTAVTPQGHAVKGNVCKTPYVSKSRVEMDDGAP